MGVDFDQNELKTMNENDLKERVEAIGVFIDKSYDAQSKEGLKIAIDKSEELFKKGIQGKNKSILHYYLGNAYSDYNALLNKEHNTAWQWENENISKIIINYRNALSQSNIKYLENEYKCRAFCNLGNFFNTIGRCLEAQSCFNKALAIDPNFSSALGLAE